MKNLTTDEAMKEEELTKIRAIQHTVKVQRRFLNDALKITRNKRTQVLIKR